MLDPIQRPDFNPNTYRPANEERMAALKRLRDEWAIAATFSETRRKILDDAIREAKAAGHSYPQLRDATGLAIATLQKIIDN